MAPFALISFSFLSRHLIFFYSFFPSYLAYHTFLFLLILVVADSPSRLDVEIRQNSRYFLSLPSLQTTDLNYEVLVKYGTSNTLTSIANTTSTLFAITDEIQDNGLSTFYVITRPATNVISVLPSDPATVVVALRKSLFISDQLCY